MHWKTVLCDIYESNLTHLTAQLCTALASLPPVSWRVTSEAPWVGADSIPSELLRDFALLDGVTMHHHTLTTAVPAWATLTALLTGASIPQQHAELAAVLEWLGTLVQGQSPGPLQGLLTVEEPCVVATATAQGLLRSSQVCMQDTPQHAVFEFTHTLLLIKVWAVLQQARDAVASTSLPWCAIAVRGPPHAPVGWTGSCSREAGHCVGLLGGGEHGYVVLLLPKDVWLLFAASGEGDTLQRLW